MVTLEDPSTVKVAVSYVADASSVAPVESKVLMVVRAQHIKSFVEKVMIFLSVRDKMEPAGNA